MKKNTPAPKTVYSFRIEGEKRYTAQLDKCIKKGKELKKLLSELSKMKIVPHVKTKK